MHSLPETHISESIYDSIACASALSSATKKIVLGKPDVAIWLWFWPVLCSRTSLSRHRWISVEWCYLCSDTCHCVLSFIPNNSITALIILLFLGYVSCFQTRRWTSFVNTSEIVSVKMSPASKNLLFKQFFSSSFILTKVGQSVIRQSFQLAVLYVWWAVVGCGWRQYNLWVRIL